MYKIYNNYRGYVKILENDPPLPYLASSYLLFDARHSYLSQNKLPWKKG